MNHSGRTLDVWPKVDVFKDSDVKMFTVRFERSNLKMEKPSLNGVIDRYHTSSHTIYDPYLASVHTFELELHRL